MAKDEKLTSRRAYRAVVDRAGVSRRKLSIEMGRTPNYLNQSLAQGGDPNLGLFVEAASVAGWKVYVEREGERIEIVPEER